MQKKKKNSSSKTSSIKQEKTKYDIYHNTLIKKCDGVSQGRAIAPSNCNKISKLPKYRITQSSIIYN